MKILRKIGRFLKYKILFKILVGLEYIIERELLRAIVTIVLSSFVLSNIKSNTWQFWATMPVLMIFMTMQYMKGRLDAERTDKEYEEFIDSQLRGLAMQMRSEQKGTN